MSARSIVEEGQLLGRVSNTRGGDGFFQLPLFLELWAREQYSLMATLHRHCLVQLSSVYDLNIECIPGKHRRIEERGTSCYVVV